ncbi:hypothetical protein [Urechidicola croceus]|uniref:Uncharacterized protein n=1 Tax=Urechidicola croceus TaxID=1850246 RepID=A0A1D8PAA6_9FLAO|nr:hypothetical protein [Urechidicola croceus]AOW21519.1 hypothetical protein LPB138_12890 [Urechidicola croceus]
MKNIFDDLHLYEIILLFLGVFLFLILCCALVYLIVKKENIKQILYFFAVPILMIGYSSIKEIQVNTLKISMQQSVKELSINPNNSNARIALENVTKKLESRAKSTQDLIAISESHLILENSEKAILYADKALKNQNKKLTNPLNMNNSDDEEEHKFDLKSIETVEKIKTLAKIQQGIKTNPNLLKDKPELIEKLNKIDTTQTKTIKYFDIKYLNQKIN